MLVLISMMELLDNSESRGYRLELMHSSNTTSGNGATWPVVSRHRGSDASRSLRSEPSGFDRLRIRRRNGRR